MRRSSRAGLSPSHRLQEALARLSEIRATVVVAAAALRHQNCELDDDVARVLQRSVADRISEQIEQLRRL